MTSMSLTHGVPLMTGWAAAATKRGGVRTTWKRRYFILKDNATLSYFKDSTDTDVSKCKGMVHLLGSGVSIQGPGDVEPIAWPKTSAENARLAIITPARTFYIYTDAGASCQQWLAALQEASGKHPALRSGQRAAMSTSRKQETSDLDMLVQGEVNAREEQRSFKTRLQELVKQSGNNHCAECNKPNPTWASWNLGVFVCISCTGAHRSLGPQGSKLKSLKLDDWAAEQVDNLARKGNIRVNEHFEAKLPSTFQRPTDLDGFVQFVQDKYQSKKWINRGHKLSISESVDDTMDEQDADNRVGASMQAEASAVHASEDPMANHDWF